MPKTFFENSSLIKYSKETYSAEPLNSFEEIQLNNKHPFILWLNTYGLDFKEAITTIIRENHLDDFLLKLMEAKDQENKLIELNDMLFISIRIMKIESDKLESEQMFFLCSTKYLWSIQERQGDYFDWIRDRLRSDMGIVRSKNADYLLFLLLESVIENYQTITQALAAEDDRINYLDIKPTPEFTAEVEQRKSTIFELKKATISLRDVLVKFEQIDLEPFEEKYFRELKEQCNNLITEIDFVLQVLESKMNLIFSIQGYRLNEVMTTLTIFSVIFIPLTFLAGIYGMNFENMPELKTKYGYFILWGVMLIIAFFSIRYFKKRNLF